MDLVSKPEYADAVAALPETAWTKPRRSGPVSDNCLELAELDDAVVIRDSRNPNGPKLVFDADEFGAFVETVRTSRQYDRWVR